MALQRATSTDYGDRIALARIDSVIGQQPFALIANLFNALLLAAVLSGTWPHAWLITWALAVCLVTAGRAGVWWHYRRNPPAPGRSDTAGRALTAVATASGVLWGAAGAIFFPLDSTALQGFVIFVICGMSAGAITVYAGHLPAFRSYVVLALSPIVARLALEGGTLYLSMSLMGGLYLAILLVAGNRLNRTLSRSLALQAETAGLSDDLAAALNQAGAADEAKTAFLANLSHELRTPLNAVIGFAEITRDEIHGPLGHERYREYLDHVSGSGIHLLGLIEALLDLSRAEAGHQVVHEETAVDLGAEVRHCAAFMSTRARHKGVRLELEKSPALPHLRGDAKRLRQIILNVLSNSVKFTPAGGTVTIGVRRAAAGELAVHVRDTGIGMSDEDLALALETFGRADIARIQAAAGIGIGLPLTELLMAQHGGTVTITSDPGGGTQVTLRFPAERVIEDDASGPTEAGPAEPVKRSANPAA